MKKIIVVLMLCVCLVLSGCSISKLEDTSVEGTDESQENTDYPVGALFPVLADEKTGKAATEIPLEKFTLKLPDGYAYTKVERTLESSTGNAIPYNLYLVWQEKPEKEYVLDYDGDVLLYIYEGSDTNSQHMEISNAQAKDSLRMYASILTSAVSSSVPTFDTTPVLTADKQTYAITFSANSGKNITTTYNEMLYPKTYYGVYTVDAGLKEDATRHFYGFVFSNDSEGEIFKKSEYENLFGQIKTAFGISEFTYVETQPQELQFRTGRTYEDLVNPVVYEQETPNILQRGLFYNSLMYYVNTKGRDYERKNIEGYVVPQEKPKETELPTESGSTSAPFPTDG